MLDENGKEIVEETTTEDGTQETTEIDYDKELAESIEKFETAEKNREGYSKRKAKTEEAVEQTQAELDDLEAKAEAALEKAAQKFIPKLQASLVEDTVENVLSELSAGNESKKKLIRFHFENSVGLNGTIRERLENASLIADKKSILKTHKEMAVALQNRQGLSNSGMSVSTEGQEVKDNFLSKEQILNLKARGWDDKKIQKFKDNLRK